jgi:outer membrane protein assembly factor BamB
VGGGLVYVGSDDGHVWAMNAGDGSVRWRFRCGSGVAVTPTYWRGRLLFGSTDGRAYCLDAQTGKLAWRFRAAPEERYINVRDRMASAWPIESGVVVEDGIAWFASGRFFHDGTYLYAMQVQTGTPLWAKPIWRPAGANPRGPMALAAGHLILPTGGSMPAAFSKADGSALWWHLQVSRKVPGFRGECGGTEIILGGDTMLIGGATGSGGTREFAIYDADDGFPYGTRAVIKSKGVRAYDREKLSAMHLVQKTDRKKSEEEALLWEVDAPANTRSLVLAGKTILSIGASEVAVLDKKDGRHLGSVKIPGKIMVNGLAAVGGKAYVVTAGGAVHCIP